MTDFKLKTLSALNLLWLVPVAAALFVWAARRRVRALRAFAEAGIAQRLTAGVSRGRRVVKAALFLLAMAALVVGLARPSWDPHTERVARLGRDVVFVLDCSRSMCAEDLKPNRLERAKLLIRDVVESLRGDRVALVLFAGKAVVKCPLTLDHGFLPMVLDRAGPDSVSRGGTLVGDAVRKVLDDVLDDRTKGDKDIILLTDGEDHGSFPPDAAEKASKRGVRILAIGLGDDRQGSRIPIEREDGGRDYLQHDGKEVRSRLDSATLLKMANLTGGGYVEIGPNCTANVAEEYRKLVEGAARREVGSEKLRRYPEKQQVFLGFCLLVLACEAVLGERKRRVTP